MSSHIDRSARGPSTNFRSFSRSFAPFPGKASKFFERAPKFPHLSSSAEQRSSSSGLVARQSNLQSESNLPQQSVSQKHSFAELLVLLVRSTFHTWASSGQFYR